MKLSSSSPIHEALSIWKEGPLSLEGRSPASRPRFASNVFLDGEFVHDLEAVAVKKRKHRRTINPSSISPTLPVL